MNVGSKYVIIKVIAKMVMKKTINDITCKNCFCYLDQIVIPATGGNIMLNNGKCSKPTLRGRRMGRVKKVTLVGQIVKI